MSTRTMVVGLLAIFMVMMTPTSSYMYTHIDLDSDILSVETLHETKNESIKEKIEKAKEKLKNSILLNLDRSI